MGIFEYLKRLIQELIDFNKTGAIERGNQKAVTGGAVYDYLKKTRTQIATGVYMETTGRVVRIYGNCVYSVIKDKAIIPEGYRPDGAPEVFGYCRDNTTYKNFPMPYTTSFGKIKCFKMYWSDGALVNCPDDYQVYIDMTYIV